jgi:aarF domain-containing kinase
LAVPAYYALILRSLTVLEGLALNADPNFKVLAASYPYFAKRLLTDPNPYLRDALIELLFKDGKFRYVYFNSILNPYSIYRVWINNLVKRL